MSSRRSSWEKRVTRSWTIRVVSAAEHPFVIRVGQHDGPASGVNLGGHRRFRVQAQKIRRGGRPPGGPVI